MRRCRPAVNYPRLISLPHILRDLGTWVRCLVKMVRKEPKPTENEPEYVTTSKAIKKGYIWFEMGIFTFWDGNTCRVLCVDTPNDLPSRLKAALEKRPSLEIRDPFAMHTDLLDQIILYYEISAWRVRDPVRKLEEVSRQQTILLKNTVFPGRRTY